MNQTNVIRLLGFALVICLLFSKAASALADDKPPSEEMLSQLKDLRFRGNFPSLTGFSPAKPIALASPPDSHDYTTAYQSASGCVAYFYPPSEKFNSVEFKWQGAQPCNGKPINGEGTLQIRKNIPNRIFVYVLKGTFSNGMLTGRGDKANFTFTENGQPVEDTYSLSGEFANSVLNGQGQVTWTGPADSEPSVWVKKGSFTDGVATGKTLYGQLHPYAGVEAYATELIWNSEGNLLAYQAHHNGGEPVTGFMRLYDDPVEWEVKTYSWNRAPEAASLIRSGPRNVVIADCEQWTFTKDTLTCENGNAASRVGPFPSSLQAHVKRKPFTIPLPVRESGALFRVKEHETVTLHSRFNRTDDMTCNTDISHCTGKAAVHLTRHIYWWGDAELRDGELQPVTARLLEHDSTGPIDPASDPVVAQCSAFSGSPTECSKGTFQIDGLKFEGRFSIEGSDNDIESNVKDSIILNGTTRMTYENGAWAEVYMEDNEVTSVSDCDYPASRNKFTCNIEDGWVNFVEHIPATEERQFSYGQGGRSYTAPPPRFVPTPIPQRPIIGLPGTR